MLIVFASLSLPNKVLYLALLFNALHVNLSAYLKVSPSGDFNMIPASLPFSLEDLFTCNVHKRFTNISFGCNSFPSYECHLAEGTGKGVLSVTFSSLLSSIMTSNRTCAFITLHG